MPSIHTGSETPFATRLALALAASFFLLEWLTSFHPDYGHFIDELYYAACARRLDFGYVDHPPLAPALLALGRALLGDSLPALRLLPALAGGATVWVAMRTSWRLGGGSFAQGLTALCVMSAPMFYGIFTIFTTNCFEILFWTCAFGALVEWGATGRERAWWLAGLWVGLAVLSKHTSVLLVGAVGTAMLISPARRELAAPHPWVGAALLLLVVAPNLFWEIVNDWVSLEFYRAGTSEGNRPIPRLEVLAEQIGTFNAAASPVWLAGFWRLLRSAEGRGFRLVGWTCAILFVALLVAGVSRPDRVMGIYPTLFAAGAVQLEAAFRRSSLRWLRFAHPVAILLLGAVTLPVLVPLLSPESAARYTAALGEENEIQREVGTAPLLLILAHRMGSQELVDRVAAVHAGLPAEDRRDAIVLAEGYAPAAAVELLGGPGLPAVYSPHNNYYRWGPPPEPRGPVIAVGFEPEQLEDWFGSVDVVARNRCEFCMGWRRDMPIAIARDPKRSLRQGWPALRRYGSSIRKLYLLAKSDPGHPR